MIKIENVSTVGWEAAVRGMRNPMNSWDKSDSIWPSDEWPLYSPENVYTFNKDIGGHLGEADLKLMEKLAKAGSDHAKFRRMITVYMDITAPLYWWSQYDTYKVGTVANSCSKMHKIADKEFTLDDFSCEHLIDKIQNSIEGDPESVVIEMQETYPKEIMLDICMILNHYRDLYLETNDKKYWWQMIQLLPSSYNQKRTVMLSYEVLANMYKARKCHKLDEWVLFCDFIETLPYAKEIIQVD